MTDTDENMIGKALKVVRLYWGMSQGEIAERIGLSQSMVSEIERGQKQPTLDTLQRYSDALGVRISQLLFFAEELKEEPMRSKGKIFLAGKALRLLEKLSPNAP